MHDDAGPSIDDTLSVPSRRRPRRGQLPYGYRVGARLAVATLSFLVLAGSGLAWVTYQGFSADVPHGDAVPALAAGQRDLDGKDQNILLIGNDSRSGDTPAELAQLSTTDDGGSANTDTMMIVHVPGNGAKAALISMPRDSYVAIDGHGMGKLNSAYPDGYTATSGGADAKRAAGGRLLVGTVQNLTGLTVDYFVQVDLLGFYRISNAIGGVKVNLCAAMQESNSGINLHKGINVVKGKQALAFVRQRYGLPNGDLDRVQRQRYFLTAAFRKLASAGVLLNPLKLQRLLTAVQSSFFLDEKLNPTDLAGQLERLSANNIVGQTIPTDGFGTAGDGESIVKVNPAEVKTFVSRLIGTADSKLDTAKAVAPSSVTVDVMNAGSADGAATQNADTLRQQGFVIGTTGTSGRQSPATVIEYSAGMEAKAKTLAAYVPGATLQKITSLSHVTLLLGSDGLTAKAKPVTTSTGSHAPTTPTVSAKPKPKAIDAGCIN